MEAVTWMADRHRAGLLAAAAAGDEIAFHSMIAEHHDDRIVLALRHCHCVCAVRIRAEATTKSRRWTMRRYRHRDRCPAWSQDTRVASFFEAPIAAQVEQMRLGERLLANLQRLAAASTPIVDVSSARRRQLERELEDLARQHAHRRVSTEAYLAEHERLTALIDAIRPVTGTSPIVDPDIAITWLRATKAMWKDMDEEGRRELIAAFYERITVTSDGIVNVELTREAQRHGAALALPETVALARPPVLSRWESGPIPCHPS
jgi:hypothetical protein